MTLKSYCQNSTKKEDVHYMKWLYFRNVGKKSNFTHLLQRVYASPHPLTLLRFS